MITQTILKPLGLALLLAVSANDFSALAQEPVAPKRADTLRRELTLVADHILELPASNKLNTQYQHLAPTLKPFRPNYVQKTFDFFPAAKPSQLIHANRLAATVDRSGKRGYLNLGVGTLFNLRGDLGYRALSTEKDQLGLYLFHRSTSGTLQHYEDVGSVKAKDFRSGLGADYAHRFEASTLKLNLAYQHRLFNYHGIAAMDLSLVPNATDTYTPLSEANTHGARLRVGTESNYSDTEQWRFAWAFQYDWFKLNAKMQDLHPSYDQNVTEHKPELSLQMKKNLGADNFLGVDLRLGGLFYEPDNKIYSIVNQEREKNYYFAEAAPSYILDGGNGSVDWKLELGLGLSVSHIEDTQFRFFPKIDAALHFANTWKLYAKASGGLKDNGLKGAMQEMPFLHPNFVVNPSFTQLESRFGVTGSISEAVMIDLYGRYSMLKDMAFYRPFGTVPVYGGEQELPTLVFKAKREISLMPYYSDANRWGIGAKLEYRYEDKLTASVEGEYSHWDAKNSLASGQPALELNARLSYAPLVPLRLSLLYYLRHGVDYYDWQMGTQTLRLKDIHLLTAQADYRLNESFSFYAKAENLLNKRYELFPGYPGQGLNVMLGANVNF